MWPFTWKAKQVPSISTPAPDGNPQAHSATVPAGKTVARFAVLEDFPHNGSHYCPGLTYNVREGNKKLQQQVQEWVKEGKAKWL